ncbi:MAG: hypothetical protein WC775_04775 [Patescibacteria group bacterium]|jgi:hypothetical protein
MRLRKNSGQLIIITLLLLATFALVGASVTTQMVFEQKKATLEDKTQKAYFAAESGIEKAIQSLESGAGIPGTTTVGTATVNVSSSSAGGGQTFSLPGVTLNPGQPLYVDLTGYTGTTITVCWGTSTSSIQSTLLYTNTISETTYLAHYAFNSTGGQNPQINGGTTASYGSACGLSNMYFSTITLPVGTYLYSYMTIVPLYAATGISIQSSGAGANFPVQGSYITSTASVQELDTQVVRRIKYFYSTAHYPPYYLMYSFFGAGGVSYGFGRNW